MSALWGNQSIFPCLHTAMHTTWLLWLLLPLETNSSTMVCKHPFGGAELGIPVQDLLFCIYEMCSSGLMGVLYQTALSLYPVMKLWYSLIYFQKYGRQKLSFGHMLCSSNFFQSFVPSSSTLKKKKKKKEPGPTLLSEAIFKVFIPPDQCLSGHQFCACN